MTAKMVIKMNGYFVYILTNDRGNVMYVGVTMNAAWLELAV